ncbi:glycosyl hydrolase [Kribbella catacumbae]|uniref:glycosyl hydrolase n=1 Tax=Kribbella catacumbae TaxID=460086 RepID=UPI0003A49368|nr:glycosyl hydrolase [Kribbella catacumbae]
MLLSTGLGIPAQAKDQPYRMTLDDFSGYADDVTLASTYAPNPNGGPNTASLVDSPFGDDLGKAMSVSYSFANGYSGRSRVVEGYWPGLQAINLWIQNGTPGQDVLLQLNDGASHEAHLNEVAGFDETSTAPQHITIPVAEFKRKTGTGTGTLDPAGTTSVALYVNQVDRGSGGTIVLDELELVLADKPYVPSVSFPRKKLHADGASNLITLLNSAVELPRGRIVQAAWTSSKDDVLADASRLSPKGDFRKNGSTEVRLSGLKIFQDGRSYTVPTDTRLRVNVQHLPRAVDVVDYLNSISGKGTLSAMHHDQSYSNPAMADVLHQRVANEFGVYPAFYGADFLTGQRTVPFRQNMINEVNRQWANGNLVQIMFHVSPPQYSVAEEIEGDWGGDSAGETMTGPNRIYSFLYEDQWKQLMTDGTPLNLNWKSRMDEYARYLQQLEDAGVTVMLRPFHEMNQHVFWWGGRPGLKGSAGLYRMFHDYLEKEKGLSNIVWVWNVQDLPVDYGWTAGDPKFDRYEGVAGGLSEYDADTWDSFNPGKGYYDVLSVDFYDPEGYVQRHYDQAKRIADRDGKPMIIGETFVFPSQPEFAAQPDWALAMPWGIRTWNYNTKEAMATFYENSIPSSQLPRFKSRGR